MLVSQPKLTEFKQLFTEFITTYLPSPAGRRHIQFYEQSRIEAHRNLDELKQAADRGEDVTDRVLLKLLPHSDTVGNRERGAFTHVAPSVTKDVKQWFEGIGWVKPADWPAVAADLLTFYRRLDDNPGLLAKECTQLANQPHIKGFQAGFLSPILNSLKPDSFVIFNKKDRLLFFFLTGKKLSPKLVDYSAANALGLQLIGELEPVMKQLGAPDVPMGDLLDMFSHYLVGIKKYFKRVDTTGDEEDDEEDEDSVTAFPDTGFELLEQLHQQPTRAFYLEHKDTFRTEIEEPFKALFKAVVARLTPSILSTMESESGVFSRILKNDFKHGGAWDFYWAALYPKGLKRTEDAQLYLVVKWDHIGYGFSIGEVGQDARPRFLRNLGADNGATLAIMRENLAGVDVLFSTPGYTDFSNPEWRNSITSNLESWFNDPGASDFRIESVLTRDQVVALSRDELADRIANLFKRLEPLVTLTTKTASPAGVEPAGGLLPPTVFGQETVTVNRGPLPEYTLQACSAETGLSVDVLERWVRAIRRKGQAIIYGPPGTGKTYLAERLGRHLTGGGNGLVQTVQFHPSYAYEDFIQGIRPKGRQDGGLDFPVVPGRFLEFATLVRAGSGTSVLILDEINRANLSRVFGELMYLLEYRDREIPLASGGTLAIPANLILIGTMNTADRSIALVDHALRRRFAFLHLKPDYDLLAHFLEKTSYRTTTGLVAALRRLNKLIDDPGFEVGVTFFLRENLAAEIDDIWRMEIEPYLEEIFFDQPQKLDKFRWETIAQEIAGG